LPGLTWGNGGTTTGCIFGHAAIYVSTVGADEETVRVYIQQQEKEDLRLEQLGMFGQG